MALTRITKGVIKPNENYDTHNIVSTGIVTSVGLDVNGNADISGSLSVGGVLTYEDVTSVDSIGIITARTGLVSPYADIDDFVSVGSNIHLGNAGVVTATSFVGDGSNLTNTGSTLSEPSSGTQRLVTTSLTTGTMTSSGTGSELAFDYANNHLEFSDGTRATFGTDNDLQLYHTGNEGNLFNSTGHIHIRASSNQVYIDGSTVHLRNHAGSETFVKGIANGAVELYHNNVKRLETSSVGVSIPQDLDVDGHTNLDNVSVAGVSTFTGTLNASTVSSTAFIASGDLDVDGHTFLDNVSIAGVTTVSSILDATNTPASIRIAQDIQHKGDADTKITFPAADTVSIETAGSERLRINSYGQIGINTTTGGLVAIAVDSSNTNPLATGFIALTLKNTNTTDNTSVCMDFNNSVGGIVGRFGAQFKDTSDKDTDLYFATRADGGALSEKLRIDSEGRLLIGKTSGDHVLDINASNSEIRLTKANASDYTGIQLDRDASGNAGGYFALAGSTNNYITGSAQHDLCVRSNANLLFSSGGGTERLRITSAGRLGIGEDNPDSLLHLKAGNDRSSIRLENTYDTPDNVWELQPGISGVSNTGFCIRDITDSANRFVIDGNGNIGINDNAPANFTGYTNLSIHGSTGGAITFGDDGTDEWEIYAGDGVLKIYDRANTSERLRIDSAGQVLPGADDAQNLGSSTKRWANIYAADMHYSNEGGENSVDGTWGSYTIQEGESDLYLLNNRNGKKYKFVLQEVS